jgi:hypothetical protein
MSLPTGVLNRPSALCCCEMMFHGVWLFRTVAESWLSLFRAHCHKAWRSLVLHQVTKSCGASVSNEGTVVNLKASNGYWCTMGCDVSGRRLVELLHLVNVCVRAAPSSARVRKRGDGSWHWSCLTRCTKRTASPTLRPTTPSSQHVHMVGGHLCDMCVCVCGWGSWFG